jgi:hypothetical protein
VRPATARKSSLSATSVRIIVPAARGEGPRLRDTIGLYLFCTRRFLHKLNTEPPAARRDGAADARLLAAESLVHSLREDGRG